MAGKETELVVNLKVVDLRCPYCGRWFYFWLTKGDQECECGAILKVADALKALMAACRRWQRGL